MVGKKSKTNEESKKRTWPWLILQGNFLKDVVGKLDVNSIVILSRWILSMPSKGEKGKNEGKRVISKRKVNIKSQK